MFTEITDSNYKSTIAETTEGVLICFKENCPHCKNMEKVLEKFANKNANVSLYALNSEKNEEALKELDCQRAPTIIVIKQGKMVARKGGLMNPKEMKKFYTSA